MLLSESRMLTTGCACRRQVVATIMSEMATDASGPAVFEENWRLVSEVASTSLARHEGIADALFEVRGSNWRRDLGPS